jgi:hypothetical protein
MRNYAKSRFTLTPFVPVKHFYMKTIPQKLTAFTRNGRIFTNKSFTGSAQLLSPDGKLLSTLNFVNGKADTNVGTRVCILKIGKSREISHLVVE